MPKVKIARKSTHIDMTAMCDVAFLLLTFFILTAKFSETDPTPVTIPGSISEIKIPDVNILTIVLGKDGRVFLGIDNAEKRVELLKKMGDRYKVAFTGEELKKFSAMNSFGVPIQKMKPYLALDIGARNKTENALGIPCDSTDNQLADWLFYARDIKGKELKIAVKGDKDTPYPMVKKVISTLQDKNENKFNLITGLEANPLDDKKKK